MNTARRSIAAALAAAWLTAASPALKAQPLPDGWPDKPIHIVVPFAVGGTSDALARLIGQKLAEVLKQNVIVDNKAGAGGVIGADAVAKSPPDGYTLLLGTIASQAINPALQPKMPYNATTDFAPVFFVGNIANVLLVGAAQPYQNVKELVAAAKAKPGTLGYGTPGAGSSQHLSGVKFSLDSGVQLVHVPYRGSGPSMQDLIGGQIPLSFDTALVAVPQLSAGKVRALAVTSARRSPVLPDVPTLAEAGLPGFDVSSWQALYAPAGTPPAIVDRLNHELTKIVAQTQVAARFYTLGVENVPMTPAQLGAFGKAELAKWEKIVREGKLKSE